MYFSFLTGGISTTRKFGIIKLNISCQSRAFAMQKYRAYYLIEGYWLKTCILIFIYILKKLDLNWFGMGRLMLSSHIWLAVDVALEMFSRQAVFLPLLRLQPLYTCTPHSCMYPHANRCSHAWVWLYKPKTHIHTN